MLGTQVQFVDQTKRVIDATEKAAFRNFGHAAAGVRKTAVESIEDLPGSSPVGTPPHTHTQKTTKSGKTRKGQLPKAIVFDATKESAIIGPRFSVVGPAGEEHEFGKDVRGEDFEARPFMGPAMEANLARFADDWQGSIGE